MQSILRNTRLVLRHNSAAKPQPKSIFNRVSHHFRGLNFSRVPLPSSDEIYAAGSISFLSNMSARYSSPASSNLGSRREFFTSSNYSGMPSVSLLLRSPKLGSLHCTSMGLPFSHRRFLTMDADDELISQDSPASESASLSDVAPSRRRARFKSLRKTSRFIMQILDKEALEEVRSQRNIPEVRPGYIIEVKMQILENRRRISTIKGIVIGRNNCGLQTTIRVRRIESGVGVETILHLYSPNIKAIKVLEKKRVRTAKLYYLRDKRRKVKEVK